MTWVAPEGRTGRNLRNVWTLGPEPFAAAHFATFPTKLVEPCIKAGTSERGCCPACGAPWKRTLGADGLDLSRPQARRAMELFEASTLTAAHLEAIRAVGIADTGKALTTTNGAGHNRADIQALAAEAQIVLGGYYREFLLERRTTVGWAPSCPCNAGSPIPCTVLDIFGGAGTTSLVADRLGRDSIYIDLSAEYAAMAKDRIYGDSPLFAEVES